MALAWTSGLVICAAIILIWNSGMVNLWLRRYVVGQIEKTTGTRVELGRFQLQLWGLHIELDNLTLHGLEDSGMPPLVHADKCARSCELIHSSAGSMLSMN